MLPDSAAEKASLASRLRHQRLTLMGRLRLKLWYWLRLDDLADHCDAIDKRISELAGECAKGFKETDALAHVVNINETATLRTQEALDRRVNAVFLANDELEQRITLLRKDLDEDQGEYAGNRAADLERFMVLQRQVIETAAAVNNVSRLALAWREVPLLKAAERVMLAKEKAEAERGSGSVSNPAFCDGRSQ